MSFTTLSPNMLLPVPTVGAEAGPTYAYDINSCLTLIDSHDHTPGKGTQLTTASLNINANLPFNGFYALNVGAVELAPQSTTPPPGSVYESGVDLFYVDGLGNNIQITASGGIAGTPGSITGLVPPASVTYVPGSKTFVFASDSTASANLDAASLLMRNITPNSTFALTLQPPAGLASNYSVTLPTLPLVKNFVTMDTSGVLAADSNVDNSTLQYSSNTLAIKNSGVGTAQIANGAVTLAKLDASAITTTRFQDFTANGTFTVPAGITQIAILAIGGGGGGGGGGRNGFSGSGGAGSIPQQGWFTVVPADSLTVTIGSGGSAGVGQTTSGNPPTSGGSGTQTSVARSGVVLILADGADPGSASNTAEGWSQTRMQTAGAISTSTAGGASAPSSSFGAGGTPVGGAIASGGGAGYQFGNSVTGNPGTASGVSPPGNKSTGGAGYGAGGGGGQAGSTASGNGGGNGGTGAPGFVRILWVSTP